jgi:hypothetical protein
MVKGKRTARDESSIPDQASQDETTQQSQKPLKAAQLRRLKKEKLAQQQKDFDKANPNQVSLEDSEAYQDALRQEAALAATKGTKGKGRFGKAPSVELPPEPLGEVRRNYNNVKINSDPNVLFHKDYATGDADAQQSDHDTVKNGLRDIQQQTGQKFNAVIQ